MMSRSVAVGASILHTNKVDPLWVYSETVGSESSVAEATIMMSQNCVDKDDINQIEAENKALQILKLNVIDPNLT